MSTILEVYKKYKIPSNLQLHMLRVTSVGEFISTAVHSISLDQKSVITALLLHDMANIFKIDIEKSLDMFDMDERDVNYWKKVKEEMMNTYGTELHQATFKIAQEVGVNQRVLYLIENLGSSNLSHTVDNNDWEQKIVTYSDFRVGPWGYLSVDERFDDIIDRYKDRWNSQHIIDSTNKKRRDCLRIESQLEKKFNLSLADLPNDQLDIQAEQLKNFEL